MKKLLTLSVVAMLLLVAGSAFATSTRTMVMGETNNILLDEDNIWLYPSRINMYPNIALGEVGWDQYEGDYSTLGMFGVHWKFGEKNPWILGTYFHNWEYKEAYGGWGGNLGMSNTCLPFMYYAPDLSDWYPSVDAWGNQRITLFYGRKLGNNQFGFYLNKVHASEKGEGTGNEYTNSVHEYDFGFGLTDANGKWDVAAGVNMFGWSWKDGSDFYSKPKGNMSFWLNGRMFKQLNPQWTIVPNAGFIFGKYQADFYYYNTTIDNTEKVNVTSAFAGLGAHYTPAANVLVVGEFGLSIGNVKYTYSDPTTSDEYKDKFSTMPYFKVGLEGKVFDWMDLRAGATSYWQNWTEDYTDVKYKYSSPVNQTYLGTGMHFGNLHIDTYTNPEILLNGFDFISGNSTSDLNAKVTILYEFK